MRQIAHTTDVMRAHLIMHCMLASHADSGLLELRHRGVLRPLSHEADALARCRACLPSGVQQQRLHLQQHVSIMSVLCSHGTHCSQSTGEYCRGQSL